MASRCQCKPQSSISCLTSIYLLDVPGVSGRRSLCLLCEQSSWPSLQYFLDSVVHCDVSQTAKMGRNTIIYTETLGMGQVHNETPFVSLMMFGYHSKAVNIHEGAFFS